MADELNLLSFVEFIDKGNDRKIRTFKERSDVINLYDDEEFRRRIRLAKTTVLNNRKPYPRNSMVQLSTPWGDP